MTDQVTHQQLIGLTVSELQRHVNKQIGLKAKMADKRAEITAAMGTITTNIHNIRSRIRAVQDAAPVEVTDHAIIRYLQRVQGIDIDAVRNALDCENLRESVKRCPTGRHYLDGVTYVVQDKVLVTVIYDEEQEQ